MTKLTNALFTVTFFIANLLFFTVIQKIVFGIILKIKNSKTAIDLNNINKVKKNLN